MTYSDIQAQIKELEAEVKRLREQRFDAVSRLEFEEAMGCREREDTLKLQIFNLIMEHCV